MDYKCIKPKSKKEVIPFFEGRFIHISGIADIGNDLSSFPFSRKDVTFETDKDKSRDFAEVFTPIHIVDEMLCTVPEGGMSQLTRNLDLCAGQGQFSIRMLRYLYAKHGDKFNLPKYLREKHFFNELQISSCYKLLWIFGGFINLAIGDALQLTKLPLNWRGVWLYVEGIGAWVNITGLVKSLVGDKYKTRYKLEDEHNFVRIFESLINRLNHTAKEYNMEIKQIMRTHDGRRRFLEMISEMATDVEKNWQDKATPEWVVKEMIDTIPGGVESLKKILVLFNAEFLECLVKEKGVDPKKIDFGYDSEVEGLFASAVYRVHTFSIGKSFETMRAALSDKGGRYDVVFSNPPYQVSDGGGSYGISASPIYHDIVMYAIDELQPRYISMITPSRWMAGGRGLDNYRARMLADDRIRMIQDFRGTNDVFTSVSIAGGVSYFLWDRDYHGSCEFNGILRSLNEFDILVRDNAAISIIKKVLAKHPAEKFCNKKVLPSKPFGLRTNFNDWVEEGVEGAVKCYTVNRQVKFVGIDRVMDTHEALEKYKVCIAGARSQGITDAEGEGKPSLVTGYTFQVSKGEVCTETYIVVGAFNSKKEADNYEVYLRTKFYRFMLSLRVISQLVNREKFAWVPDFGDYSVEFTDKDLYDHFGLTKKEIDHIEKTIKSLD